MSVRHPRWVKRCLLGLVTIASLCVANAAAAAAPGVWQLHKVTFHYLGITPTYSCQGLQDSLTALLKESGARPDVSVVPRPCSRGYTTPEKIIYADLKFSTLTPAASADTASSAEGTQIPGAWHHVTITAREALQGGNCELVQEFKNNILRLFMTRNIKANLPCVPYQFTDYFSLGFDVFAPSNASLPKSAAGLNGP